MAGMNPAVMAPMVRATGELETVIKKMTASLNLAATATTNVTQYTTMMAQNMLRSMTGPLEIIQGLAGAIGQFVQFANPAVMQLFTLAVNDLMGVIGGMLVPVMQGATIFVRAMADAYARLQPVIQPLFDQLGVSLGVMGKAFAIVVEALAPLTQILTDSFAAIIHNVARGFLLLGTIVGEVLKFVFDALGMVSRFNPGKTGKGAAAYNPTVSSVEGFAREQFAKSLIRGPEGQGKNPVEEIAVMMKDVQLIIAVCRDFLRDIKGFGGNINLMMDVIKNAIQNLRII